VKPAGERWTVAVDFDGVLHSYTTPWIDAQTIPDPPVEGAIEWLNELLDHFVVMIFSTRAETDEGAVAIRAWLKEHGMKRYHEVGITAQKPKALVYLDDRAIRFEGPGTFPDAAAIHAARPWNKPRAEAKT
jgi:hypothetical protein